MVRLPLISLPDSICDLEYLELMILGFELLAVFSIPIFCTDVSRFTPIASAVPDTETESEGSKPTTTGEEPIGISSFFVIGSNDDSAVDIISACNDAVPPTLNLLVVTVESVKMNLTCSFSRLKSKSIFLYFNDKYLKLKKPVKDPVKNLYDLRSLLAFKSKENSVFSGSPIPSSLVLCMAYLRFSANDLSAIEGSI